jgi:hypothetical protein
MKHEEADFSKQVLQLAKLLGWRSAHFRPGMMANGRWITAFSGDGKGFPDLVLVRGKRLLFVELKTNEGELSDEQISWMADLFKAGIEVMMWCPMMMTDIQKELERE